MASSVYFVWEKAFANELAKRFDNHFKKNHDVSLFSWQYVGNK